MKQKIKQFKQKFDHKIESIKKKDYCSFFFDSIDGVDISDCCKDHDKDYEEQILSRRSSDVKLMKCVNKRLLVPVGSLMFLAVRCIGWIFWWKAKKKRQNRSINGQ